MDILKIVFLPVALLFFSCKNTSEAYTVSSNSITESVYASGRVKAENQYAVYATVSGVLLKKNAEVGSNVNIGQTLFEIENDKAQLATQNTELAYQLSKENSRFIQDKIAELEMAVQTAKDKYLLDKSIFERNKNIKDQGGISEVDYQRVEMAYHSSELNYQSSQKRLAQLRQQLKNEEQSKAINLKINQKSQADFYVKSAISGKLFNVFVEKGALVNPQTPLAIIGNENDFLIELEVDENDMVKIMPGQLAVITLDSYKNQVFEATVVKIYPIMDERSRTFKIEARFINPPKKMYPNLTTEANIIIKTKKNTVVIPKEYLIDKEFVLLENGEKHKVRTGLSDYKQIEIINGLHSGERIIKP
ncbi:efflux RND transporter periplasmic adaptor subunit [Flavobacterium sp. SM15]|uniref:efflux RND transporter periplasmic adaptor subunit n=1 Tax=Flavobacterium sp. SM15 TaxID=2908005 RepID=UPI001EDB143E|nr:efflux RND transporter periplasmic adaptor subunit [Flavobacterium sp. SM15]MCG2612087.1 efflux RND transporter periplasmic adaptor subunit [Flavobacterium sp. SM15]